MKAEPLQGADRPETIEIPAKFDGRGGGAAESTLLGWRHGCNFDAIALDRRAEPGQLCVTTRETVTQEHRPQQFDERAALEELERLAERIQVSRRQRAQAVEEFDAFVRGFRLENRTKAAQAAEAAVAASAPRVGEPPTAPAPRTAEPARPAYPPPVAPGDRGLDGAPEPDPETDPVLTGRRGQTPNSTLENLLRQKWVVWSAAAAAVLLVFVVVLLWLRGGGEGTPAANPTSSTPSVGTNAGSAPAQPAAAPAAPPRALNVEVSTVRPVWTRVTVDDRRVVERELPGGQRLSFGADRTIIIRAGDAGAIRVVVDGKDVGVLGRDGQIASRSFVAR
jgi:Domain of unknown function (DUF4115)